LGTTMPPIWIAEAPDCNASMYKTLIKFLNLLLKVVRHGSYNLLQPEKDEMH